MDLSLLSRLRQLDKSIDSGESPYLDSLCRSFVTEMSTVSFRGTPNDVTPILDPVEADSLVGGSEFMSLLRRYADLLDLSSGTERARQRWTKTGRPPWLSRAPVNLNRDGFEAISGVSPGGMAGRGGLYTSTATSEFPGMWRLFLELNAHRALWPRPWSTWTVVPQHDARIRHISRAVDWCDLLEEHHQVQEDGYLGPDWQAVARRHDAVHFTPDAICAVEGYRLTCPSGLSAPVYWDVECTLWLRWVFDSVEHVATEA